MKYVFIVNPTSGKGNSLRIANNLEVYLKREKINYEMIYTQRPKDASMIARKYRHSKCIIYSVGGDGTLNEVLRGVMGSKNMLGIIPGGTGNDFYKTLKSSNELYQKCDIGKVNNDYFINTFSVGIDADVCDNIIIMKRKNIPTKQLYNASLLYTFMHFKPKQIRIEINDEIIEDKITLFSVCNGTTYGGGFKIAPGANLDDGLLDVYIAVNVPKVKMLGLVMKLLKGRHEESKYIKHYRTNKIKVISDIPLTASLDGEIIIDKEFNIKLLSNKITVYNNADFISKVISNNLD